MKNDEGDFCNFELCGILITKINHSLWILYLLMGFFIMDSLPTKSMI